MPLSQPTASAPRYSFFGSITCSPLHVKSRIKDRFIPVNGRIIYRCAARFKGCYRCASAILLIFPAAYCIIGTERQKGGRGG